MTRLPFFSSEHAPLAAVTVPTAIAWTLVVSLVALAPTFDIGKWLSGLGGDADSTPPVATAPPTSETPTPTPTPTPLSCEQIDPAERDLTIEFLTHSDRIIQRISIEAEEGDGAGGTVDIEVTIAASEYLEPLGTCADEGAQYVIATIEAVNPPGLHYDSNRTRFSPVEQALDIENTFLTLTSPQADLELFRTITLEDGIAVIFIAPERASVFDLEGTIAFSAAIDVDIERYPGVPLETEYLFELQPLTDIELDEVNTGFCTSTERAVCAG